ncbi:MAG: hypothetical protein ACKPFK_10990, partial [Dolichospermum sp.]
QELQLAEVDKQREARLKQQEEWDNSSESIEIKKIDLQIQSLMKEEKLQSDKLDKTAVDAIQEGKSGQGSIYKDIDKRRKELEATKSDLKSRINGLKSERENLRKQRDKRLGESVNRLNISPSQLPKRDITTT